MEKQKKSNEQKQKLAEQKQKMNEQAAKLLKKGQQIARTLADSGMKMKECSLPDKRVDYFRGEDLKERMEKNLQKLLDIYYQGETTEQSSVLSFIQKLLKDRLLVKLERVKEEKMYKWPRKLDYSNVCLSLFS